MFPQGRACSILAGVLEGVGCMPIQFADDVKLEGIINAFDEQKQNL